MSTPAARTWAGTASRATAFPWTSASPATRTEPRSAAAGDRELVLRVADPLLDLPAIGRALAALDRLQLGACRLQLLARPRVVDLIRVDGVVDERDRAVLEHLEEAWAGRELEHVGAVTGMDPRRARLQRRDQRRVPREHADLAVGAGHDDHLGVAL